MGGHRYSLLSRSTRATKHGYSTKTTADLFEQVRLKRIHEKMDPKNIIMRESRDSEVHPTSFPIILALDVTGSMREIPRFFLSTLLPKLISKIIQNGCPDPALLMMAIGDSQCDAAPLQVAEFESGDEQLDMWLQRVWPEGGGGGNAGESYLLAWHFAALKTVTDSFEKRNKKGILITIGDEPSLHNVTAKELKEIYGSNHQFSKLSDSELLEMVSKKYEVYHLHMLQGSAGERSLSYWVNLLGQRCIPVSDFNLVDDIIADLVIQEFKQPAGLLFKASDNVPVITGKVEPLL